jgi:O-antigen ligase
LITLFLATPFIHLPVRGLTSKIFRVIYLGSALPLIVMSKAKTAWCVAVLYLALILILIILRKFRTRDSVALALATGIASTGLAVFIYENSNSILQLLGKDPTINQRTVIWSVLWEAISKKFFLGYGFAAFWRGIAGPSLNVILVSGWMVAQAQNGYLDLWLSVGVVGVGLLIMIMWRAFRDALICLQLKGSPSLDWYMGILLSTVIYNFSESFLLDPRHICWIMFLIACVGLRKAALSQRHLNHQSKQIYQSIRVSTPKIPVGQHASRSLTGPQLANL